MIDSGDDGFDMADAAIAGGIAGFIYDSIQAEEEGEDDLDESKFSEAVHDHVMESSDVQLRLLYNENPELVKFLVRKVQEDREKAINKIQTDEYEQVLSEMKDELSKLEEEEKDELGE